MRDLEVLIQAADHAQLFEELWRLREGEKLTRENAGRNDVVTRAFRRRFDQDWSLDFTKTLLRHVTPNLIQDAMAKMYVCLKLRAAEIEITILKTKIFARERIRRRIELERRRA